MYFQDLVTQLIQSKYLNNIDTNLFSVYIGGSYCLELQDDNSDLDLIIIINTNELNENIAHKYLEFSQCLMEIQKELKKSYNIICDIFYYINNQHSYWLAPYYKLVFGNPVDEINNYSPFDDKYLKRNLQRLKNYLVKNNYKFIILADILLNGNIVISKQTLEIAKDIKYSRHKKIPQEYLDKYNIIKEKYSHLLS